AREANAPHTFAGGILMASGVMYFRFVVLIGIFSIALMRRLLLPFLILGAIGVAGGWLWSSLAAGIEEGAEAGYVTKNPMELATAGVIIAAASNNFAKAFIALAFADPKTGRQSLILLLGLTALGLLPLFWIVR